MACAFAAKAADSPPSPEWHTNYQAAREGARTEGKSLLVWFYDPAFPEANSRFQDDVLGAATIATRIESRFVAASISIGTSAQPESDQRRLIDHAAFAELRGRPGLAIVDFADEFAPTYGCVVSVYPFSTDLITQERLDVLLALPPGTLTQRTLIFAIRTHRDLPASAAGDMHPLLADEAASHARYQAGLKLQGHHHWNARFHAINAQLPAGHVSYEVCAESWPGQTLLDAAEECVESWRHSSGHWGQVSGRAEFYGYDMQRGTSGVWYATGIFGKRR